MIIKMLKASFIMSLILSVIWGFIFAVKAGYDHIPAFHSAIDAIGPYLMHNPFA